MTGFFVELTHVRPFKISGASLSVYSSVWNEIVGSMEPLSAGVSYLEIERSRVNHSGYNAVTTMLQELKHLRLIYL